MKQILIVALFWSQILVANAQNFSLLFDGKDDQIDLFHEPLKEWTLSTWVKGNDLQWDSIENIISNGWVSVPEWEINPLCIKNGLPAIGEQVIASQQLDDQWHHLAATCKGNDLHLYMDGNEVARGEGGKPICPSFVGSADGQDFFTGELDEIRIWNKALDASLIKEWMNKTVTPDHPCYTNLVSCYHFDDQAQDATDLTNRFTGDIKKYYRSTISEDGPRYQRNDNRKFKGFYPSPATNTETLSSLVSNPSDDPNTLKVLEWNIWHGGVENGTELGRQRVVDIIKHTNADVILMIETYGAGPFIAEQLGYQLYTLDPKDNLSIISRYPIVEFYPSQFHGFFSLGAKVQLPNKKEVVVWNVWLRYALPDYTLEIHRPNYTAQDMINGDQEKPVEDLKQILKKDIARCVPNPETPVILAGDFNSCSHLDWTKATAAAGLHYGMAVDFPTSHLMEKAGFKDSYRELHPNPITHIGRTWSPLYNYCKDFRIDFIYYRGSTIEAISSKVIDKHPVSGTLFPSDHAGVLSTFEIKNE